MKVERLQICIWCDRDMVLNSELSAKWHHVYDGSPAAHDCGLMPLETWKERFDIINLPRPQEFNFMEELRKL